MQWLADENIPGSTIRQLRRSSIDIAWVAEGFAGISDFEVLSWARRESRGILSFDQDFGELIFRHGGPPPLTVVLVRFFPVSADELGRSLEWLLSNSDVIREDHFVTLSRDGARSRRFP